MTPDRLREFADALVERRNKALAAAHYHATNNHSNTLIELSVAEAEAFRLALTFLHISSDGAAGFTRNDQPDSYDVVAASRPDAPHRQHANRGRRP